MVSETFTEVLSYVMWTKKTESRNLNKDISRLESVISQYKNNNEEYIKIKKRVEEEVSMFLKDSKVILQFPLASVFESIRKTPGKSDNLVFNYTSASSTLTSTHPKGSILSHIEDYWDMIVEEANTLYDSLLHHFTNSIMDNAAGPSFNSSLSSTFPSLSNKSDPYKEKHDIHHNSKGDITDWFSNK